jgi:hypothetical protein
MEMGDLARPDRQREEIRRAPGGAAFTFPESPSVIFTKFQIQLFDHSMQVGRRIFDVKILVLPRPALRGEDAATVDCFEIGVTSEVAPYCTLRLMSCRLLIVPFWDDA